MLQREFRWLQRMTRRLAGCDAATADDLTQDTLLRALAQPPNAIRRPRQWLRAVAINLMARNRRRELRRREVERDAAPPGNDGAPSPDEVVMRTQLLGSVVEELLALPEPYRTALLLRFQEGLALADAAARVGLPAETLRTRQKRGLAQLRARLDRRHGSRAGWVGLLGPSFAGPVPLPVVVLPLLAMAPKILSALLLTTVVIGVASVLWFAGDSPRPIDRSDDTAEHSAPAAATASEPQVPTTREAVVAAGEDSPKPDSTRLVATGRVVDEETGAAIQGASIGWRRGAFSRQDASSESTTTAADGSFALRSSVSDAVRHELVIRSPDHALFVQRLGTPTATEPPVADVGTVKLPPGTGVHGEVVDADELPVSGAELLLCNDPIWTTDGLRRMQLPRAFAQGRTDTAGRFTLSDRVCARGPSHRPLLIAMSPGALGWRDLDVRRSRNESRDNRVTLWPSARLHVRVVDERGMPVVGARIVAEPRFPPIGQRAEFPLRLGPLEAVFVRVSDAGGRAVLALPLPRDVEAPAYSLRVTAAGRAELVHRDVRLALDRQNEMALTLATERSIRVRGRVVDVGGQPIAGAEVAVGSGEPQVIRTGSRGEFEVTVVDAGAAVVVRARAANYTAADVRLPIEPGRRELRCNLELEAAKPLHGVVVDQHDVPIAEAVVHVGGMLRGHVRTDGEGRFEVARVPAARAAAIEIHPPSGSNAYVGPVHHAARPGASPLRIVLERLASGRCALNVEIVGAGGERLEVERLYLNHLDRRDRLGHPATPTLGAISAMGLRPGRWRLEVCPVAGPGIVEEFVIVPNQDLCKLRLVQSRGVGLRVGFGWPEDRALAAGGAEPVLLTLRFAGTGQRARFLLPDGSTSRTANVDPRSRDTIRVIDVDPGRALVVTADAGGWIARTRVAPGALDGGEVRLQLAASAAVQFESTTPWPFDGMTLQFRHAGDAWGEPMQFSGMQGATTLVRWPLAVGVIEWRLTEPTVGADNTGEPRVHRGTAVPEPGQTQRVVVRPGQ